MHIDRAVIEVNGGCNYSCQMCPQSEGRGKNWLKKMSLDFFEDIVAECAEKGLRVVNLEGSGEATLNTNLPKYIEIVRKYGAKPYIFSNGYKMQSVFMKDCVDAGLAYYRFSCIGYNREKYQEWMNTDAFHRVLTNAAEMVEYCKDKDTTVASYHLILDNNDIDHEIAEYRRNFVDVAGTYAEIWKMHNWSGVYDPNYGRTGEVKTCGRPFSPDLVIRSGGLDGHRGAVAPCCQVLGQDDKAVLGHLDTQSIDEVWNGPEYEDLRQRHLTGNYPDFCQGCDFLIDDPEVLVWSNSDRDTYKMVGTEFTLRDFQSPR